VGSKGFEAARTSTLRIAHAKFNITKIKMQHKLIQQYNGYTVQPSTHRLPDGSFSSNLLLERIDGPRAEGRFSFYSLDYFESEAEALQHSTRWGCNWVDARG
jgi:hypothetical protein